MNVRDKQLDDFLKRKFSSPQKIYDEVYNKKLVKLQKEVKNHKNETEKMKEFLVDETKQMFERNKRNFKEIEDFSGFKYKVELLQNSDRDHKTLRDALGLGSKTVSYSGLQNVVEFQIYRVKENNDSITPYVPKQLLLHGTKVSNVEGILKEGIKPSLPGLNTPGVYLTNSVATASEYGKCYVDDNGFLKSMIYMFIMKMKFGNTLDTLRNRNSYQNQEKVGKDRKVSFSERNPTYVNGKKKINSNALLRRYVKVRSNIEKYENEPPLYDVFYRKFSLPSNLKFDSKKNVIIKGTFTVKVEDEWMYISHHDLVTPAYLVEIEVKNDLHWIVKDLLYNTFDVCEFYKTNSTMLQPPTYSVKMFIDELKKEIEANQQQQIKFEVFQFYQNLELLLPQLTFKVNSLFKTLNDGSFIYKTISLHSSNKDYKFIKRSLNYKGCASVPNVLHMFKIVPADQTDVEKFYNNYFYLQGVTADKVINILKQGYPENKKTLLDQCEKYCFDTANRVMNILKQGSPNGEETLLKQCERFGKKLHSFKKCSCYSSGWLDFELKKGTSYCKVGDDVKELSFVFVTNRVNLKNIVVPSKIPTENLDSRQCRFDPDFCSPVNNLFKVPAYLIVFSL